MDIKKEQIENNFDKKYNEWFENSEWSKISIQPDSSINMQKFAEQNILNPEGWKNALRFISESDFNSMAVGRYELGNDVFSTVFDYFTKEADSVNYEAHRKFIDIQYVSKGKEYIGLTSLEDIVSITQPYDSNKDIEFFIKPDEKMLLADPGRYLVFFPTDGHKPCLKVENSSEVRKVVIKIPYFDSEINVEAE